MVHPTLMEQLLNLESKVLAIMDMEDTGHYLFNLKQPNKEKYNVNYKTQYICN